MKHLVFIVLVCVLSFSEALPQNKRINGNAPDRPGPLAGLAAPGTFGKASPANAATGTPTDLLLSWQDSPGVLVYEYCLDTSDDDACSGGYLSAGPNNNVGVNSLAENTTYFWQVRAVNQDGTTYADGGAWWHFTTQAPLPAAFHKLDPPDNAAHQAIAPTLRWEASLRAVRYEYCLRAGSSLPCDSLWTDAGSATSVVPPLLNDQTTYEWTVRAVGQYGITYADDGPSDYWRFTTASRPAAFSKTTPANESQQVSNAPTLAWEASGDASSYEYCLVESIAGTGEPACMDAWVGAGENTHASISDLKSNATYFWQVRAIGPGGTTYANQDTAWQFTTLPSGAPPNPFSKQAPIDQLVLDTLTPILRWEASSNATRFDYCIDTTPGGTCTSPWISAGTHTSQLLNNLDSNTTYYWQVRAYGPGGTTYADGSPTSRWRFTTLALLPGDFSRLAPLNGEPEVGTAPTLSWEISPHATAYEYCLDTSDDSACAIPWMNVGLTTTVQLNQLEKDTTYFWHVRAISPAGVTYAGGAETGYWHFTTIPGPTAFNKSSPQNAAGSVAIHSADLSWTASSHAASYAYCLDTFDDDLCDTGWSAPLTDTHVSLPDLEQNTRYYWQVRADGPGGERYADDAAWWYFTTQAGPPGAFQKSAPAEAASAVTTQPTNLSWTASSNATQYEYCLDTSQNNTCNATWINTQQNTSVLRDDLKRNTIYSWQVRATGPGGTSYANDGTWWHFTTQVAAPASFSLRSPADGAVNVPTDPSLVWAPSSGASAYEYCLHTTSLDQCPTAWVSAGNHTSVSLAGLAGQTTYYWLVRASGAGGVTEANAGAWRRFTTRKTNHNLYLPLLLMYLGH